MPASIQPATNSAQKTIKPANLTEEFLQRYEKLGALNSIVSRENSIRNAVKKWSGPNETSDPKARVAEHSRQEVLLQTLLRLHRLSCNLVPEHLRVAVHEHDIFAAIVVLNRISITLGSPSAAIVSYCEARSIRETHLRVNQLDPLQLRHLLTFHQDIPHEELNALDIQSLKAACEKADKVAIQTWFETIARRKTQLPKDAPQFLRQLATDLWNAGKHDFLETYATELAVLDAAMLDALGWENSRLFFAIFKRIHGASCRPASAFLTENDLTIAIELSKQLKDSDETVHFRALSTTYDAQKFRRLERTILAASKETGSRIRTTTGPSLLAKKLAVQLPPAYATPEFYAQKSFRPVS